MIFEFRLQFCRSQGPPVCRLSHTGIEHQTILITYHEKLSWIASSDAECLCTFHNYGNRTSNDSNYISWKVILDSIKWCWMPLYFSYGRAERLGVPELQPKFYEDQLMQKSIFTQKWWCLTLLSFSYGSAEKRGVPELQSKLYDDCLMQNSIFATKRPPRAPTL